MKPIGIMVDTHSSITKEEAQRLGIHILPMPFYVNGELFYEERNITREEFYEMMRQGADVSTSQSSPQDVMDMWDELLKEYEKLLFIPLSSGLSGSCQTAQAMAQEPEYEGRVLVVDNGRVATPQHRSILDALELIEQGHSAEEVKELLEAAKEDMSIYIALNTLDYLKKGGRVNPAVATVATVLNIKPIMQLATGKLDSYQNCRGFKKARSVMIDAMRHDLETKFKAQYEAGEVYLLAASSSTPEVTKEWVEQIEEAFPGMKVMCDPLSLGVSCHIGPEGLGIGCSCKVKG